MFQRFKKPISDILAKNGIKTKIQLLDPPSQDLGDFCLVVNQFAGSQTPNVLAEKLLGNLQSIEHIETVEIFSTKGKKKKQGITYLNFEVKKDFKASLQHKFVKTAFDKVFSTEYGQLSVNNGKIAIVEHTSANPISPLHVGNLRNSIQGDTYARILNRTGFTVFRHFYVNDVGLQVSFVVIGYEMLKKANHRSPIKFDVWLGQVYAVMNNFYSIQGLKQKYTTENLSTDPYILTDEDVNTISLQINEQIDTIKRNGLDDGKKSEKKRKQHHQLKRQLKQKQDEIRSLKIHQQRAENLRTRFPEIYNTIYQGLEIINLHEKTASYLLAYEKNSSKRITTIFKEVVLWIIEAFQWSLERYNINFDQFDFESDVTSSGLPEEIVNKLSRSENAVPSKDVSVRYTYPDEAIDEFCKVLGLSKDDLPIRGKIPDLQLRRSDNTLLYAAKDIAYSIKKYEDRNPDVIFNVISAEQALPQFQLLLPLFELGFDDLAKNLTHYTYEHVDLRGRLMSGRLASYVTADEFYDETIIRARIAKRTSDKQHGISLPSNDESWEEENQMLRAVTLASTRFPLIETSPNRKIELDLDRELDFKRNSGPFVQYAHARASGVLRKIKAEKNLEFHHTKVDYSLLASDDIIRALKLLLELEQRIEAAWQIKDPSQIANWCFDLAQLFMKVYEKYPVLQAESEELMLARVGVVMAIKRGLFTGLDILGIPAADKI
ncbi:MAG: arginine--tRNA ligase domain-containing protein [Candidatus Kariarchaeaceae archaeon]